MLLLLFVIGLCVSGIRLEPLGLNYIPQQDNDLSQTMFVHNVPGLWDIPPQTNMGAFSTDYQNDVNVSPMFNNNNVPNIWLRSPELIVGRYDRDHTGHRNVEMSATYVKNNLPGVLFEKAKLSSSPMVVLAGAHKMIHEIQTDIPQYIESMKEIEVAEAYLKENLLSMSGAIPYLIDHRRDFAEIISVISGIAIELASRCVNPIDYDKSYQKLINKYAVDGISNAQAVINDVAYGLNTFHHIIMPLQRLIQGVCPNQDTDVRNCNFMIHEAVIGQPEIYQKASILFFSGHKTAHEFNNKINEFSAVSKCHTAHKMIIEAPAVVKPVVYALTYVIRGLTSRSRCK